MSPGTIVDVGALWQTVWTAAVAGLLVTVCCSFAVLGWARSQERRLVGAEGPSAVGWTAVGVLGTLATLGVVAYGVSFVVS